MRKRTFWLYILPLLVWMGVIFYLSSQTHSSQNLQPWLNRNLPDKGVERLFGGVKVHYGKSEVSIRAKGKAGFAEFWIRKSAHVGVYFVLGLLAIRLWLRVRRKLTLTSAGAVWLGCALYASSDEIHQYFTGDRTPMIQDVLLDSTAALVAILLYVIWHRWKGTPARIGIVKEPSTR